MAQREIAPHCTDVTAVAVSLAGVGTETFLEQNSWYCHQVRTVTVTNWTVITVINKAVILSSSENGN